MNIRSLVTGLAALLCMAGSAFAQIQAGRAVGITISGVAPEEKARFDEVYPVSETGTINLPYIGRIRAAGLNSEQLANALEEAYKKAQIYTDPKFQVIDSDQKTVNQQVVYVGDRVRRPGPVPYTRTLTLNQAIQAAGGADEFGSIKRVKLYRNGKDKTYDLRLAEMKEIRLEPNDTIEVPMKDWKGD